jgi:hypothetical protein
VPQRVKFIDIRFPLPGTLLGFGADDKCHCGLDARQPKFAARPPGPFRPRSPPRPARRRFERPIPKLLPMSNHPRSRARSRLLLQACFIGPFRGVARGRRLPFPSPSHEGAERRNGAGNVGHLNEGAHLPRYRQARLPALHRGDFCRDHRTSASDRRAFHHTRVQAALALPFIRCRPSHSRRPPHRGRTMTAPPGTGLRIPPAGAAPCSAK